MSQPPKPRTERDAVVREARSWLGTPFHHGARVKGHGVDCAQLLIGVYTALGYAEEPDLEFYSPNWFLHEDAERFLEHVLPQCAASDYACLGDIALFRFGRSVSHGAIVVQQTPEVLVVHAMRGFGVVLDSISHGTPLRDRLAGFWTLKRWAEAA